MSDNQTTAVSEINLRVNANAAMDAALAFLRQRNLERLSRFDTNIKRFAGNTHELSIRALVSRSESVDAVVDSFVKEEGNFQFSTIHHDEHGYDGYGVTQRFLGNTTSVVLEYMIQCFHEKIPADFVHIRSLLGAVICMNSIDYQRPEYAQYSAELSKILGASQDAGIMYGNLVARQDPKYFSTQDFVNNLVGVSDDYKAALDRRLSTHRAAMKAIEARIVPGRFKLEGFEPFLAKALEESAPLTSTIFSGQLDCAAASL